MIVLVVLLVGTLQPRPCSTYPSFVNLPPFVRVRENAPKGTEVLRLSVSGEDSLTLTVDPPLGQVLINSRTYSIVTTEDNFDYERNSVYSCAFTLAETVRGIMQHQPVKKIVTLRVDDVNDNAPEFVGLPYIAYVLENSAPGTPVFALNATDRDSGYGKVLEYAITGGNERNLFYMVSPDTPNITLNGALDYEREQVLQIFVNATDNYHNPNRSEPRLSTKQLVVVNVVDTQDTPPYFNGRPYVGTVAENSPLATSIISISAEDGDRQRPRRIKYFFLEGTLLRSSVMSFSLSEDTGVITLTSPLDRENLPLSTVGGVVTLVVQAHEIPFPDEMVSYNALLDSSTVSVKIEVTDADDNPPTFSTAQISGSIVENAMAGVPIMLSSVLTVSDPDMGKNGTFTLVIRKDGLAYTDFYVRPLQAINFAIVSIYINNTAALDFETVKVLTFQVTAISQTIPMRSSTVNVVISIMDANDNNPQFVRSSFDINIPENSPNNTLIVIIKATDIDTREFGMITYALKGSEQRFRIDGQSGAVYTNCSVCLDREVRAEYFLTVAAMDGGGLTSYASLNIHLADVNDNPPKFVYPVWNAYLKENSWQFATPVVLKAFDEDDPDTENSRLTYSITGGDPFGYFSIDSKNGSMTVRQPADAEQFWGSRPPLYLDVSVTASDRGRPSLSTTAVVRVLLEDVNDNAPSLTTLPADINIMENVATGTIVHTVAAIDRDLEAPNNQISYRIENGSRGLFQINARTGNITVVGVLDKEQTSIYQLTVSASDLGQPSLSVLALLTIHVADVNDMWPKFSSESLLFSVLENATVGAAVGRMAAVDPDASLPLTYSIDQTRTRAFDPSVKSWRALSIGEPLLGIGRSNGSIYVASPLDRERASRVELFVIAKDSSANPPQSTTGMATINILDINDNPPQFDRKEYVASIVYDERPQKTIIKLQDYVIDPDLNPVFRFYQTSSFSMPESMQRAFTKDPLMVHASGEVTTEVTITQPLTGDIVFTVAVNDSLGRGDTAVVRVYTIGRHHMALLTMDRPPQEATAARDWIIRLFKDTTGVTVAVDRIEANAINKARSDIYLYVPRSNSDEMWTTEDVLNLIDETPSLKNALSSYGMKDAKASVLGESSSIRKDYVVATAICAVTAVLLLLVVVVCFVARRKLKRKLREAHSVSADTHVLGFDLGPIDTRAVPVITSISNSLKRPMNGMLASRSNTIYRDQNDCKDDADHSMLSWMHRNGAYDSRQQKLRKHYCGSEHRNSVDENAVMPLTSSESCDTNFGNGCGGISDTAAILSRPRTPSLAGEKLPTVVVSEHQSPLRSLMTSSMTKATPPTPSRSSRRPHGQYFNSAVIEDQTARTAAVCSEAADGVVDRLLAQPLEPPAGFQTFTETSKNAPVSFANTAI